jgi:DNA polymerase-3 subunit gamma/tau
MVEHLHKIAQKENIEAEDDALRLIAEKADGGLRDCLSMFDQMVSYCNGHITYAKAVENLNILDRDYYFKMTDSILNQNISEVLNYLDEIINKGFDGQTFLGGLSEHFRNLMVCKDISTVKLLDVGESHKVKYEQQCQLTDLSFFLCGFFLILALTKVASLTAMQPTIAIADIEAQEPIHLEPKCFAGE